MGIDFKALKEKAIGVEHTLEVPEELSVSKLYDIPEADREKISKFNTFATLNSRLVDWLENFKANLNLIWKSNSVLSLSNKYEMKTPAIVVGAGSSLKKNVHLLKDFKGIVVCCDRAFEKVAKYRIPDYVVCLESQLDPNYDFLFGNGLNKLQSRVKGLFVTTTHPKILNEWKGEIYFYHASMMDMVKNIDDFIHFMGQCPPHLGKSKNEIPVLDSGANVGTMSWALATSILKCNPVGLIGLDFCEYDEDDPNHKISYYNFMMYAFCLAESIKHFKEKGGFDTINATEGGILEADWIPQMTLKKFIKKYDNGGKI
jgi:hypothetical protein